MQRLIITGWFLISSFCLLAAEQTQQNADRVPNKEELKSIYDRIDQSDYRVFFEVARYSPKFAVPFLTPHLRFYAEVPPEDYRVAQAALRTIDGAEDYLANEIQSGSNPSLNVLNALAAIGSKKACAIIAPYLFSRKAPPTLQTSKSSDVGEEGTVGIALTMLYRAHLSDDPTNGKRSDHYTPEDLAKWRGWAVAHGYVSASEAVGFPMFNPTPSQAAAALAGSTSAPPILIETKASLSGSGQGFGIVVLIFLAALVGGVAVVYARRRS